MTPSDAVLPASRLEMRGIVKDFGAARALDRVDFDLRAGEIHAICGENGAGKSTLIKTLAGVYPHGSFGGTLRIDGREARFHSTRDSEAAGIAVIYQELSFVPDMTVAENIFLGAEPLAGGVIGRILGVVDRERMLRDAGRFLGLLGLEINPAVPIGELTVAQRQLVEIAKALSKNARILVLDEPTSALADREIAFLVGILKDLRGKGVGCVYISHRFEEVFALADRITVLRDGRSVGRRDRDKTTSQEIIALMVGRDISVLYPKTKREPGAAALRVEGLTAWTPGDTARPVLREISFEARRGEILGISGLMGSGRSELLMCLFGAWQGRVAGRVVINGREARVRHPSQAMDRGLALVTEDRKRYGLHLELSVIQNETLAALRRLARWGWLDRSREAAESRRLSDSLRVKAPSLESEVGALSGGNQQKVVLAKWLMTEPSILMLDEPTRGIDIGAKSEIHALMTNLKNEGMAIVMVSSELPEVLGMSDRILVMREGRLAGELSDAEASPERIMALATGQAAA